MFSKQFSWGLIWQVVIKFLAIGLGFFTTRWLVEVLNPSDYRDYNLVLAYNAVLLVLIDFGIPQTLQKIYTHNHNSKENSDIWTTITILRIASYFLAVILICFTYPISQTQNLGLILALFTAQFILVADLNYRSICQAVGRTWQFSLTDFLGKIILVLGLILGNIVLYFGLAPLYYFVAVSILAYSISLIIDAIWQRQFTHFGKFNFKSLKENFGGLFYLALSNLAIAFYLTTDKLFLAYFKFPNEAINSYSNAYKLFEIAQVVPGLVMPAISSLVTKQILAEKVLPKQRKALFKYAGFGLSLGITLWLGVVIFGSVAVWLIDTQNKYQQTIQVLPILAISLIFICPMLVFKDTTIFLGKEKYDLITTALTATLAVSLYLILIPNFGIQGAAYATIISYSFDLIIKAFLLNHTLKKLSKV
jgi:O-antigen/teichoic acid export membrane protein